MTEYKNYIRFVLRRSSAYRKIWYKTLVVLYNKKLFLIFTLYKKKYHNFGG